MIALELLKMNMIRFLMPLNDLTLAEIEALAVMAWDDQLLNVSANEMAGKLLLLIHFLVVLDLLFLDLIFNGLKI